MEWYITDMRKKRQKASLERMLEMESSDDDNDDDDDESSITSKFSQVAQANEEEYKPTEEVDIQPNEGFDVVLSLTDEQYKNTMFRKFDALGPKETPANQGVENEAVQQIFDNFKTEMKSDGRFLLMGSNYRSKHKKYRVVGDKEAKKSKFYLCLHMIYLCQMFVSYETLSFITYTYPSTEIRQDLARRNLSTWHSKGEVMQVNTKKGGNIAMSGRGRPSKKLAKKRGSIIKNFSQKRPFLSKSSTRAAGKAKSSIVGNRKASESDTDGLSDSDDSSVESTRKVAKKDIVEMDEIIPIFNDIKTKVKGSRGNEKVFYIHLKKYIAQQIKKDGVLRSDFDKIQDFMSRMIPNVNMLNEATDEDEITVYEAAINAFIKECKAELPLSFFIKLE